MRYKMGRRLKQDSKAARSDMFAPTRQNRDVECWHCGWRYKEGEVIWERRAGMRVLGNAPLWWCKNPVCDGAGIGFDIHPVPNATDVAGVTADPECGNWLA